jgi:hypothetical protein
MRHRLDAPGMRGDRTRDIIGELRKKRGDTLVKTLEKKYDHDFGVRSDMRLDTLLKKEGVESLKKLLGKK